MGVKFNPFKLYYVVVHKLNDDKIMYLRHTINDDDIGVTTDFNEAEVFHRKCDAVTASDVARVNWYDRGYTYVVFSINCEYDGHDLGTVVNDESVR